MAMKPFALDYDPGSIEAGILHFGVGNFHRAHQAYYTNKLLSQDGQKGWGICGAMILDRDEKIFRGLKAQGGQYGLTVFGRSGDDEYHQIGALTELYWAGENAAAIIDKVAEASIKIITLTITEGGYNLAGGTGEFDFSREDILYDLRFPERPRTVFGYVAAGLRKRMEANAGPVAILSCDNLVHNGNTCKKSFLSFLERADALLWSWAKEHVSFPNCMVDRITPATLPDDISKFSSLNGHEDLVPVYCEDYVQWVIEDDFPAGRPAWERVGVEFTDDVSKYESMKLGYVNSTHQMLSFPGLLAGYRRVDEALDDKRIASYLRRYMDEDVTPYLAPPPNTSLDTYKATFMERLKNKAVSDQLSRLCFDAANKIPVYMAPTMSAMLRAGAELKRVAFLVAAYRLYLRRGSDDKGVAYAVDDPKLTKSDWVLIGGDEQDFLGLSCFGGLRLADSPRFVALYLESCQSVEEKGVLATIEGLL